MRWIDAAVIAVSWICCLIAWRFGLKARANARAARHSQHVSECALAVVRRIRGCQHCDPLAPASVPQGDARPLAPP